MAGFVERVAQPPHDQPAHRGRIAEADFGLGRVDIDIDLTARDLNEQRCDRVAVAGEQVAVGGAERPDQQAILHRARIDEQILLVGHPAIEGRQADHPGQPEPVADKIDAEPIAVELVSEQRRDARRRVRRLQRQDSPSVMIEREADIGARHRQPLNRIQTGGIFGARGAQKLAPGRHLVEQAFDPDSGAGGKCARPFLDPRAMVDDDPPALRAGRTAVEREPRHRRDRGQGLAAKAEADDAFDMFVGKLGGGMAFERKAHLVGGHAAAVVGDLDQLESPRRKPDRDRPRAGVERIFDQFFQRASGAFDDLARGDAVDQFAGEPSY